MELETGGKITEKVDGTRSLWEMLEFFQNQLRSPGKFTSPSTGSVVLFFQGKEVRTPSRSSWFPLYSPGVTSPPDCFPHP